MAQPLSVLFVAGSLGGGGAERRLVDVLKHLDPQRICPRLYLAYRRGELLSEVPDSVPIDSFWDGRSQRSVTQRLLAKFRCPSLARACHLRSVLKAHKIDAVISWSLLPSYEAALSRWRLPIPQIASVGLHPLAEIDDAFGGTSKRCHRRARWTYQRSNLILANSADLHREYQTLYRLPASQVQCWLQTKDFDRIERLARAESPVWPAVGRRVVAAGRLCHQKGFDLLLAALANIHSSDFPVQLAILGQGPDEQQLRAQAAQLGIAGQVQFLGFQENPFPYFRTADLFVLSSRFEGNPNALIEAMACSVPVLSTDCPTGPREIFENGTLGRLVPVDDVNALANGLRDALVNGSSTAALARARHSVLNRYGLANATEDLETWVRSVMRQNRNSTHG